MLVILSQSAEKEAADFNTCGFTPVSHADRNLKYV